MQDLYIAVSIRTEVIAIKLSDQKSGEFKSDAVSVSASLTQNSVEDGIAPKQIFLCRSDDRALSERVSLGHWTHSCSESYAKVER